MKRRTAAALMITRGTGQETEVFLAERAQQLRFFGGYHAFPGGTVDPEDGTPNDGDDRAVIQECGRRELFEETGLVWQRLTPDRTPAELEGIRRALLARDAGKSKPTGDDESDSDGVKWPDLAPAIDGAPLRELCRVETPPFAPVRYDTVFCHVPVEACRDLQGNTPGRPEVWTGELTSGRFWRPADALAAWRSGEIFVVPPVVIMLEHLDACGGNLEAFAADVERTTAEYRAGRLHQVRFSPGIVLAPLLTPTLPPATTTNCYVVGRDRLFVIDPGSPEPAEQQRLDALLTELEGTGSKVEGILLTHHHPDHIGGVVALSQARNLPVHGHPLTLDRLPAGFIRGDELTDGSTIELGVAPDGSADWRLTAIHTPGHDRGHLCFRESRYDAVIVGDMLSTISTIIIDPPEGHLATYLQSLERLAELPISTLYPAHGPAMRHGQRLVNQYVRHRRQRESALVKSLAEGGGTIDELVPKVYWDADPRLYRFAARSLLAGLEKLEEEGRAGREGDVWSSAGA